ncbi:RNA polymerase sigma factor [Actinorhabdospora filicis]|nr:RNA polymerase sigma factor [Actinorhabdospora filicis]
MNLRQRIRDGDPAAFREIFDEHARAVYNHAWRLTGDWSAAEDAVSLTFLEAWRLRARIEVAEERGSPRPWLLGIATNVARNVRRAARRYDHAVSRMPRSEDEPDHADAVAGRLDDRERLAAAMAALASLRRNEREVIALCVGAGLDYAQAAEALGVPVGTVRSRLSRARKKLAKKAEREREPLPAAGQVRGDRVPAVRFAQEKAR